MNLGEYLNTTRVCLNWFSKPDDAFLQRVENTPLCHWGPQIPLFFQNPVWELKNFSYEALFVCLFYWFNHQRKKQPDPFYSKPIWAINFKSISSKQWGKVQGTGSLSQLQLNWLSNLVTFQPQNEQIGKVSLFISLFTFFFFPALPTINIFKYCEGFSFFALMYLGLIMRTQHPNFKNASSQKELFLNQLCCIIGIILEPHKLIFKIKYLWDMHVPL